MPDPADKLTPADPGGAGISSAPAMSVMKRPPLGGHSALGRGFEG
jgi:hypothetical protein